LLRRVHSRAKWLEEKEVQERIGKRVSRRKTQTVIIKSLKVDRGDRGSSTYTVEEKGVKGKEEPS